MAVLDFPANPTEGQKFTGENGIVYTWTLVQGVGYWSASSNENATYLLLTAANGPLTGNLGLPGGGGDTDALQKQEIITLTNGLHLSLDGSNGPLTGPLALSSTLSVEGNVTLNKNVTVTGTATFNGGIDAFGGAGAPIHLYSADYTVARTAGDAVAYYSNVDATDGASNRGFSFYSAGTGVGYFKGAIGINTDQPACPFHIIQPATDNDFNWNAILGSGADGDFRLVAMSGETNNNTNTIVARFGSVYQGNTYNAVINFVRGSTSNDGYFRFKPGQKPTTVPSNNVEIRNNGNLAVLSMSGQGTINVNVNNDGELTTATSDSRLKHNIETLRASTEIVKQLRPVSFNWRDTAKRGAQDELGFIAQEVKELVPEVVYEGHDGLYGMNIDRLIPVLTKALQEALTEIDTLKARLTALES